MHQQQPLTSPQFNCLRCEHPVRVSSRGLVSDIKATSAKPVARTGCLPNPSTAACHRQVRVFRLTTSPWLTWGPPASTEPRPARRLLAGRSTAAGELRADDDRWKRHPFRGASAGTPATFPTGCAVRARSLEFPTWQPTVNDKVPR